MPLGCLIFHEQKGLQLREWQSHLINITQASAYEACDRTHLKHLTRKSRVFICYFTGSMVEVVLYLHFFTQRMTDFERLKRNMNDGTIVFLMSLLIALT